jgi:hypothetical protein
MNYSFASYLVTLAQFRLSLMRVTRSKWAAIGARRLKLVLFITCSLGLEMTATAFGQITPTMGLAPFQVRDTRQFDSINLYDSGVMVDIPVVNKPGIMPFKFDLIQQSDAGVPLTGTYQHQTSVISSGLQSFYLDSFTTPQTGLNPVWCSNTTWGIGGSSENYMIIVDSSGTQHTVYTSGSTLTNPIPFNLCVPSGQTATATGITLDWSGYTIAVTVNAATNIISYTLTDTLHGFVTTNPNANTNFTGQTSTSNTITITDPNNNIVTQTTTYPSTITSGASVVTTWTDATGSAVMTITSPYWFFPNCPYSDNFACPYGYYPTSYTYYDANNNPQTYTVSYNLWQFVLGYPLSNDSLFPKYDYAPTEYGTATGRILVSVLVLLFDANDSDGNRRPVNLNDYSAWRSRYLQKLEESCLRPRL